MTVDVIQNVFYCTHMHNNLTVKTPIHTCLTRLPPPLDCKFHKRRVMPVVFTIYPNTQAQCQPNSYIFNKYLVNEEQMLN